MNNQDLTKNNQGSNKGDLISREALKKACSEMVRGSNNSDFIPCPSWNNAMELIDNAPTVEQNWRFYFDHGYKQAESDLKRPQGEWIDTGDMQEYWAEEYQCSICGAKDHWHNYCPNCGAKMKRGTENEQL